MRFKFLILIYTVRIFIGKIAFKISPKFLHRWRFNSLKRRLKVSDFYVPYHNLEHKEFPRINKEIFMSKFDRINTVGLKKNDILKVILKSEKNRDFSPKIKGYTAGLSTGTSGNRGVFLASEKERAQWVATILDRVLGWSLKRRKIAFF